MRQSLKPVVLTLAALLLGGCGPSESPVTVAPAEELGAEPPLPAAPSPTQMAQWTRNCALCHVRGEGGAPVLGDQTAWTTRSDKGVDVLLAHTLEGFNNMPPLGYCMDCTEDDFRVLIRFMGGAR